MSTSTDKILRITSTMPLTQKQIIDIMWADHKFNRYDKCIGRIDDLRSSGRLIKGSNGKFIRGK